MKYLSAWAQLRQILEAFYYNNEDTAVKKLSMFPCVFTIANAACGFAATIKAASYVNSGNEQFLVEGAWLIILAMLFDAFDGKLARMANATSDFGGQLDSLADAVSFGIAPAALVVMWNSRLLAESSMDTFWAQMTWIFCLAYAMAALLRLARFNVETGHSEEARQYFVGLPTPGAGGLVASLIIFQSYLVPPVQTGGVVGAIYYVFGEETVLSAITLVRTTMPLLMIVLAFLMVSSRIRYVHVLNRMFREKRTFDYFTYLLFSAVLLALVRQLAFALVFATYVALGPITYAVQHSRSKVPSTIVSSKDKIA